MQSAPPVGGTPLLPPSYLTVYFGIFLVILTVLYIYFYRKNKPVALWHKIRLVLLIAFIFKTAVVLGGGLLVAYWLVPSPSVRRTFPVASTASFSPTDKIEIVFDRPVSRKDLEKSIYPEIPGHWVYENSIYTTHLYRKLVFYPSFSLHPDTTYTVYLSHIRNLINLSPPYDYQFSFTTQDSPQVVAVTPSTGQTEIDTNLPITITLDSPNSNQTDFDFQFTPHLDYTAALDATQTVYTITPQSPLSPGTNYTLKVHSSDIIQDLSDQTVVERTEASLQLATNFSTKPANSAQLLIHQPTSSPVFFPQTGSTAIDVHSRIKVDFGDVVNPNVAQNQFSISPAVDGAFTWDGPLLIFTPHQPLAYSTTYTIAQAEFTSQFTTQNATTKLAVPVFLQKYALSCEITALRMALDYKGLSVSEDELISQIGQDPTPRTKNVWGNPHIGFVGNINGTQMQDGYGVYWEPIAKAARFYRNAQDFQGWTVDRLTDAIAHGHPVIAWVYSNTGNITSWKTPNGTNIYAVDDEHAVVVVGFVGPAANPTRIIVNDPLSGQVYWPRAEFDRKWDIFNQSGVVVY